MKTPMTTEQVIAKFGNSPEGSTCSIDCKNCGERIWFRGSWYDAATPETFECPYCRITQRHPYKHKKVLPRLDKDDLSVLIELCKERLASNPATKPIIQSTLDKLNAIQKELH